MGNFTFAAMNENDPVSISGVTDWIFPLFFFFSFFLSVISFTTESASQNRPQFENSQLCNLHLIDELHRFSEMARAAAVLTTWAYFKGSQSIEKVVSELKMGGYKCSF